MFGVSGGGRVVADLAPCADRELVGRVLYGPVAALVLGQQGRFALHASTIAVGPYPGVGVALAGRAGVGKSTTLLELQRRGHRAVVDDLTPVDSSLEAAGFRRPLHVWPDTAAAFGLPIPEEKRPGKLALDVGSSGTVRLQLLAVLETGGVEEVAARPAAPANAVAAIISHLWAARVVAELWADQAFCFAAVLASSVEVVLLSRPEGRWTVPQVAAEVEGLAAGGRSERKEKVCSG